MFRSLVVRANFERHSRFSTGHLETVHPPPFVWHALDFRFAIEYKLTLRVREGEREGERWEEREKGDKTDDDKLLASLLLPFHKILTTTCQ